MQDLYSVRMRASAQDIHLSGAERLVPRDRIDGTVRDLLSRAFVRGREPEEIVVSVDALRGVTPVEVRSLDLVASPVSGTGACRNAARQLLVTLGISDTVAAAALRDLDAGPAASGGNMRGAMVIDAASGDRLEPDRDRGVRASRFDWSDAASAAIDRELARIGLTHFRTKEALALATKVAHAPGIVAELCWSDDGDYRAGYVASPARGYWRFAHMKEQGNVHGGRAFFVDGSSFALDAFLDYLRRMPVLITSAGACRAEDS